MKISALGLTILTIAMLTSSATLSQQPGKGTIKGIVRDKKSQEGIIGANVSIKGLPIGTNTDADGSYQFSVVPGLYTVVFSFISYATVEVDGVTVRPGQSVDLDASLEEAAQTIEALVITRRRKASTEMAMISALRASQVVASGVSSQQIARTQDKDASEIVRRISGISIVDNRFVVVRGLSQRYNNVWMNGSAVPSSEADTRAFSFDMIPSSQIDNVTIVKSPVPELPADFSGGFVQIKTKEAQAENHMNISIGGSYNDQTHFREFLQAPSGGHDWLGFDDGTRALNSDVPYRLNNSLPENAPQIDHVAKAGFSNRWALDRRALLSSPDKKMSLSFSRRHESEQGKSVGVNVGLNYSLANKAYHNMQNALIGAYDIINDCPNYFFKYIDNQYSTDVRWGAMANLSFAPNAHTTYQFRNLFNQSGTNRLTLREGEQLNSGYYQQKQEFLYSSRSSYSGQLSAAYDWGSKGLLDCTAGYSYMAKKQPDRRTITRDRNINSPDEPLEIDFNDTKRTFIDLGEHAVSAAANYSWKMPLSNELMPTVKAGYYGEYKKRDYDARSFYYIFNETDANTSLKYGSAEEVFAAGNLGTSGLYTFEDTRNTDNYKGVNGLTAGYLGISIPVGQASVYAGVRFENNKMELTKYVSMDPSDFSSRKLDYTTSDLFPSVNISYNLSKSSMLRAAYGMSINRPEFRELSPSTYYDFDLFGFVKGNEDLKSAYVQNVDLRYEYYPTSGEMMALSVFYKQFKDPIESTYYENAGGYTYSFANANSANNAGVEVDLRKGMGFVGLDNLTLSLNAAYIYSHVTFGGNIQEHARPMQGQSPYLVNAGLFYQHPSDACTVGLMYNIIGERIVGVGRRVEGNQNASVPDIYEQPRNLLDLTFGVRLLKNLTLTGAAKNIMGEDVKQHQTATFNDASGAEQTRRQTKLSYSTGRTYSLGLSLKL